MQRWTPFSPGPTRARAKRRRRPFPDVPERDFVIVAPQHRCCLATRTSIAIAAMPKAIYKFGPFIQERKKNHAIQARNCSPCGGPRYGPQPGARAASATGLVRRTVRRAVKGEDGR